MVAYPELRNSLDWWNIVPHFDWLAPFSEMSYRVKFSNVLRNR